MHLDSLPQNLQTYMNTTQSHLLQFISPSHSPQTYLPALLLLLSLTYLSLKPPTPIPSPPLFTRPPATPHPSFSLRHTPPTPYRPFRHGPRYNITMGLMHMSWDHWIELDNQYLTYMAIKRDRIASRGEKCIMADSRGREAGWELWDEVVAFVCERYPGVFSRMGCGVKNLETGEEVGVEKGKGEPIELCARVVMDDVVVMLPRLRRDHHGNSVGDGNQQGNGEEYYLAAGAVLLAGFWRLGDKFNKSLSEIHTSGNVPGFRDKLEKSMNKFFARMKPESPVLRYNYFIQVDDNLAWSESLGSEDGDGVSWATAEKERAIDGHRFRSERQTLRRLPKTGAIVFLIRTYFHPITEICKEPYVPGRLASAVRSWGDDVSKYKGKERYGAVLLEYLDRKHEEQVRCGLDVSREDEERRYPF